MNLLLTGKNGQVGFELQRALAPLGDIVAVDQVECDLSSPEAMPASSSVRPSRGASRSKSGRKPSSPSAPTIIQRLPSARPIRGSIPKSSITPSASNCPIGKLASATFSSKYFEIHGSRQRKRFRLEI
ncbi:MAG TPA: sugar nucleotide-binding protein [Azonexus sp.]|nr:sugar nucleotide-binding protein [Azonexus sp.]